MSEWKRRGGRQAWTVLLLRAVGVALAGVGQTAGESGLGIEAFLAGMLCFALAERRCAPPVASSDTPEEDAPTAAAAPFGFWVLFFAGVMAAGAAGALVAVYARSTAANALWIAGLVLLVAAAVRVWWPRRSRRIDPGGLALAALLVVVAVGLSSWRLSSLPPEVHNDEAAVGVDALRLLRSRPVNLFTIGWYFCPLLHAVPTAAAIAVVGPNLIGLRAASVVMGAATVLATLAFARRWWGMRVAVVAGLVLAVSRFFLHLSRTGYHYVGTPLTTMLVAWLGTRMWQTGGLGAAVMCGVVLGLGVHGYYASRLIPVLFALTWLMWLPGSDPARRRSRVQCLVVAVGAAIATAAPMIAFFANSPFAFWFRTQQTSIFAETAIAHLAGSYGTNSLWAIIAIHARKAFTMFNWSGDTSMQYGYDAAGLLEPVSAALLPLGLAVLLARPARRENLLVLLWILLPLVIGVVLTIDAPFYPRIAGLLPLVAVAVALALHGCTEAVRGVLGGRCGRLVAAGLSGAVLAVMAHNNLRTYFVEYAPRHRHSVVPEIAAWMRTHGQGKTTYMIGGDGLTLTHNTVRFLADGYATRDIVDLGKFLERESLDRTRSVFIVMPAGRAQLSRLEAALGPLAVDEHRIDARLQFDTAVPIDTAGGS